MAISSSEPRMLFGALDSNRNRVKATKASACAKPYLGHFGRSGARALQIAVSADRTAVPPLHNAACAFRREASATSVSICTIWSSDPATCVATLGIFLLALHHNHAARSAVRSVPIASTIVTAAQVISSPIPHDRHSASLYRLVPIPSVAVPTKYCRAPRTGTPETQ